MSAQKTYIKTLLHTTGEEWNTWSLSKRRPPAYKTYNLLDQELHWWKSGSIQKLDTQEVTF